MSTDFLLTLEAFNGDGSFLAIEIGMLLVVVVFIMMLMLMLSFVFVFSNEKKVSLMMAKFV